MANLYRAIGKSMTARYAVYLFNIISLMILMRLFSPDIVGVVAAVQTIVILLQMVAEAGLSPAIINLDSIGKSERDGIFGLSLSIGVISAATMFFLGPFLAKFYGMTRITDVIPYVAIALLANTAAVMPLALLQRDQKFMRIAQAGIAAELGAIVIAYGANFKISALHAYALYFPAKAVIYFIFNWLFSKESEFGQPTPGIRFSAINPMLKTTGHQLGSNFVNYFSRNLDNILVGKYMGAAQLAIYDRAYQLMRYPLLLLSFAMTPAIQPALRSINKDIGNINLLHRDLAFKLSLLGSVCAIGVFFLAKPIVLIAFGDKWLHAVPIIRLMALIIPVQVIFATNGSFFTSLGRTDLMLLGNLVIAGFNIIAIITGVSLGSINSLCWCLFFSFHASFFIVYYILHKYVFNGGYLKFIMATSPFFVTAMALSIILFLFY